MFKSALFLYVLFVLFSHYTWAGCLELTKEVEAMKKAHQQMINSMIENQKLMASELESISSEAELNQGSIEKKKLSEIKSDAIALKERATKSQRLAEKLDAASDKLLAKVAKCSK